MGKVSPNKDVRTSSALCPKDVFTLVPWVSCFPQEHHSLTYKLHKFAFQKQPKVQRVQLREDLVRPHEDGMGLKGDWEDGARKLPRE